MEAWLQCDFAVASSKDVRDCTLASDKMVIRCCSCNAVVMQFFLHLIIVGSRTTRG